MSINNRQINTGFSQNDQKMILEVKKDTGKLKAGETVEVTKSEARRLLATHKDIYKIQVR